MRDDEVHSLYRCYDFAGVLLYIGISNSPLRRFQQHSRDKSWWQEIAGISLEHFSSRQALEDAEKAAIERESPKHNIVHNRRTGTNTYLWRRFREYISKIKVIHEQLQDELFDIYGGFGTEVEDEAVMMADFETLDYLDELRDRYTDAGVVLHYLTRCSEEQFCLDVDRLPAAEKFEALADQIVTAGCEFLWKEVAA